MAVSPLAQVRSADWIEHDDGDLALGLLLIVGVRRPEFQRLLPEAGALLARGGAGPRLHLLGADLHVDLRIGEEIAVPAGMLRRAAFRGDYDIAVAGRAVEQREDVLLARFAAGRRQKQRRHGDLGTARLGYLVHVPVGTAAR